MGVSREFRLGFVSVMLIVVMGYLISMATSARQQKNWGTPYHIRFNRIEGIEEGSKVFYNGRLVGRVRKLDLETYRETETSRPVPMRADVTISISPLNTSSVILTSESTYKIDGGIWGERWIAIQYEPGEVVPAGGVVKGDNSSSLNYRLYQGIQNLEWLHDTIEHYKNELGSGEKARDKVKALIKYWNYMAFDLRVQANKFNQFSGLINEQLDKMVGAVDKRITVLGARGQMAISQMQLSARAMQSAAIAQDEQAHRLVLKVLDQMHAMRSVIGGLDVYVASGEKLVTDLVATARKRVQEAEDMVAALRFISKNPALASQFRTLAANMRKRAGELRAVVDGLRKQVGPPRPSSSPSASPLPAGTEGLPPVPGVPVPPLELPTPGSSSTGVPMPGIPAPGPSPTGH